MCLLAAVWQAHPRWRLLLVGNRDEYFARPSTPIKFWPQPAGIIGGQDLEAGGSWLAADQGGRCAAVTNVRRPQDQAGSLSRGALVTDFVAGRLAADDYAQQVLQADYRPFNLLLFDRDQAWYASNRAARSAVLLAPGLHLLSNASLDTAWPKTRRLQYGLQHWLAQGGEALDEVFALLADRTIAADSELPATGIALALERALSAAFIVDGSYGTRASTVLAIGHDGAGLMIERSFGPWGQALGEVRLSWPKPH